MASIYDPTACLLKLLWRYQVHGGDPEIEIANSQSLTYFNFFLVYFFSGLTIITLKKCPNLDPPSAEFCTDRVDLFDLPERIDEHSRHLPIRRNPLTISRVNYLGTR